MGAPDDDGLVFRGKSDGITMKIMKGDMTVLIGEKFTPGKAASYTVEGGVMGDEIVKTVCSEVAGLARARGC